MTPGAGTMPETKALLDLVMLLVIVTAVLAALALIPARECRHCEHCKRDARKRREAYERRMTKWFGPVPTAPREPDCPLHRVPRSTCEAQHSDDPPPAA